MQNYLATYYTKVTNQEFERRVRIFNNRSSIEERFSTLSGGKVLDVATGAVNFASLMEKHFISTTFIAAIDIKLGPLIQFSKKSESDKIKPIVMSGNLLGFKNNTFNTVALSNSLHHLKSTSKTLTEMNRTLAPGGQFIIREMFCDGDQTPSQKTHTLLHNWWGAIDTANNVTHNPVFTEKELREQVNSLKLEDVEYFVVEDTSTDPFEPEMIKYLNKILETYTKRAESDKKLLVQGKIAREHLNKFGFCSSRALVAIGNKSSA